MRYRINDHPEEQRCTSKAVDRNDPAQHHKLLVGSRWLIYTFMVFKNDINGIARFFFPPFGHHCWFINIDWTKLSLDLLVSSSHINILDLVTLMSPILSSTASTLCLFYAETGLLKCLFNPEIGQVSFFFGSLFLFVIEKILWKTLNILNAPSTDWNHHYKYWHGTKC